MFEPSYWELLTKYRLSPHKTKGQILHFEGIGTKDIYNPTVIDDHGKHYIAARVESRDSDWVLPQKYDPEIIFFEKQQYGPWVKVKNAPVIGPMEDPFATWIHDENNKRKLVFGGVILDRSTQPPTICTAFYKGDDIFSLEPEPFAIIPNMKDIRLLERVNKKEIIVMTRPQIQGANTGRIGMTRIEKLSDLSEKIAFNSLIDLNQVAPGTWIGNNKLYLLSNKQNKKEKVGVLGHVATLDQSGKQHYAAIAFTLDADRSVDADEPETVPRIIAVRDDFEAGPAKTEALQDVVFPAAIEHVDNGLIKLYAGLSDSRIGSILIPDPFHDHRNDS